MVYLDANLSGDIPAGNAWAGHVDIAYGDAWHVVGNDIVGI